MEPNSPCDEFLLRGKEVFEKEAQALKETADSLGQEYLSGLEIISSCTGRVILTGMGKSGIVASKWASTFASTGTPSYFINPAEARHGDLGMIHQGDLLVALSYSGETEELDFVMEYAKNIGVPILAVSANEKSTLAKHSTRFLKIPVTEEACPLHLAPTTSTTVMMAMGDALAVGLMHQRKFTAHDFAKLHPGGSLGRRLWLKVSDIMHEGEALPLVSSEDAFDEVLVKMTQKALGLAIVLEDSKLIGIVTDGDLRRHFQKNKNTSQVQIKQVMTCAPQTIAATDLAIEARKLMEKRSIHHLIVVDDLGEVVGVVHQDDLMRARVI